MGWQAEPVRASRLGPGALAPRPPPPSSSGLTRGSSSASCRPGKSRPRCPAGRRWRDASSPRDGFAAVPRPAILGSSPRMTVVCENTPQLYPRSRIRRYTQHRPCPAEGRRPVPAPVVVGRGRRPRRRNPVTIGGAGPPSRGAVRKARRHYDRLCVGAPLRASGLPHLESRQRPAPGEWNGRRQVAEAGARMAPLLDCPSGARRAPATLGIAGGNETTHTPAATRRGIAGACPGTKKGGAPGAPPLRQAPKGAAPISAAARCGCRASAPSSRPARSSSHRRC